MTNQIHRPSFSESQLISRKLNLTLWTIQWLLAVVFLFAGVMKLAMPADAFKEVPLPVALLRFIGVAETLGAFGLVLPGLLRIRQGLTPLAAAGLVIIMIGAVIVSAVTTGPASAAIPGVVGLLAAFVAVKRWRAASQENPTYPVDLSRVHSS